MLKLHSALSWLSLKSLRNRYHKLTVTGKRNFVPTLSHSHHLLQIRAISLANRQSVTLLQTPESRVNPRHRYQSPPHPPHSLPASLPSLQINFLNFVSLSFCTSHRGISTPFFSTSFTSWFLYIQAYV